MCLARERHPPLPVRNERGEGRGEGQLPADIPAHLSARRPSSPRPSPPSAGGEGEDTGALNTYGRSPSAAGARELRYFKSRGLTVEVAAADGDGPRSASLAASPRDATSRPTVFSLTSALADRARRAGRRPESS